MWGSHHYCNSSVFFKCLFHAFLDVIFCRKWSLSRSCLSVALKHVPAMFVSFILKHTLGLLTPNPGRAQVKEGMRSWAGEPIRRAISDCTTKACVGTLQSTSLTDLHLVSPAHTQARLPEALVGSTAAPNHHQLNSCSYWGWYCFCSRLMSVLVLLSEDLGSSDNTTKVQIEAEYDHRSLWW